MSRRVPVAVAPMAVGAAVLACGEAPPPVVVPGTSTAIAVALDLTLHGRSDRTFVVPGGHWRVCDHGTVSNRTGLVARNVRITVTYVDHGAVVGRLTAADAARAGGALGDLAPGLSRDFTVCGLATAEPDQDQVEAVPG
ncbi:MAG: hypothetical protein E6J14_13655 [Chloroflexi bacterium]|nr:MAG: hypothetical protein E6J14_13655 [Chloroflexota bacterium]